MDRFDQLIEAMDNRNRRKRETISNLIGEEGGAVWKHAKGFGGIYKQAVIISRNTYPNRNQYPWRTTVIDNGFKPGKFTPSGHSDHHTKEEAIKEASEYFRRPHEILKMN